MKKSLLALTTLCLAPAITFAADISIANNTDDYGTVKKGFLCSGLAGDEGTLKPHQVFHLSAEIVDKFCREDCDIKIYAEEHCEGDIVATATISAAHGISNIDNFRPDKYVFSGGGDNVTINPKKNSIKEWFSSFFS